MLPCLVCAGSRQVDKAFAQAKLAEAKPELTGRDYGRIFRTLGKAGVVWSDLDDLQDPTLDSPASLAGFFMDWSPPPPTAGGRDSKKGMQEKFRVGDRDSP